MNYLEEYYNNYDEEGRLLSKHGQVEYLTTKKYIKECLEGISEPNILEVGAGTGRYSVTLAKQGLKVTAVELIKHNLEILKSKLDGTEPINAIQGNALDLSMFEDDTFDVTMLLGPMYHLFTREDKLKALGEAVRVTKPGGFILVAYCMNEPTVVQFCFGADNLQRVLEENLLTSDWHCKSEPKERFELVRTEDIESYNAEFPIKRIKLVATDGATNYMRPKIDSMDDDTFAKWVDYHFTICERQDLIGASHHTLDILQKEIVG
ncbi:MAG: class I SAM-dependent methyltransferase [Pseudobutyrivibrio sp.]|nr:class I SAM-dependent methyltransferase [Pseudobutyrivibrio sp.]